MSAPVTVIGIGDEGLDSLSASSRRALDEATMIVGGDRHLAMLGDDARPHIAWNKDIGATVEALAQALSEHRIAVLASGDPLLHGIAVRLIERFGVDAVDVLPSPSAFSLAAARMGWALADPMLICVSVHARPFETLARLIQPGVKLLILSRNGATPQQVARLLTDSGYGDSRITVLERMGGEQETWTEALAKDGVAPMFDNLNTLAVECVAGSDAVALSHAPGLPDDAFDHDGNITKREVRAVTLAALGPLPGETLWDVGAGNGTVAVEWLRAEPRAHAIAFEKAPVRAERIAANAKSLGVPSLRVYTGVFPDAASPTLAEPDVIFVGGGIAGDADLLGMCFDRLKSGGRLVANAVTLEAQARLLAAHAERGGELVRIAIAHAEGVGGLQAMKPAIDVLQWRIEKT